MTASRQQKTNESITKTKKPIRAPTERKSPERITEKSVRASRKQVNERVETNKKQQARASRQQKPFKKITKR